MQLRYPATCFVAMRIDLRHCFHVKCSFL
jgi:hypothetical protein